MSLNTSLGWGLVLATAATVATFVTGFIAGVELSVPGVVESASSSSDGGPTTTLFLNLLAPLALAVVLGLAIWSGSRAGSRED